MTLLLASAPAAFGQAAPANNVLGDVVAVDAAAKQIFVKTDAGAVVVTVSDATRILKNPPGKSKLDKSAPYTLALMTQMSRTAVCNRLHGIEQQLCRWLLLSHDRLDSDELVMTQELIANMLGVRREGVTHAAGRPRRGCSPGRAPTSSSRTPPSWSSRSGACWKLPRGEAEAKEWCFGR